MQGGWKHPWFVWIKIEKGRIIIIVYRWKRYVGNSTVETSKGYLKKSKTEILKL